MVNYGMKYLTTKQVNAELGLQGNYLTVLVHKHKMKGRSGTRKWNMNILCSEIVKYMTSRSAIFLKAKEWLSRYDDEESAKAKRKARRDVASVSTSNNNDDNADAPGAGKRAEDKSATETPRPPNQAPATTGGLGIEGAVERLRRYEQMLAGRLELELTSGGDDINRCYRDWITAVEQMRKSESDLLDVLERRRVLIPADEAKGVFLRMVETTKGLLLVMPAKLSGELEGMEWVDIKKRLDGEIRDILTNLSTSTAF